MFGKYIAFPVEAGSLLIWIWLEVTILTAMMQWTSVIAKLIIRSQLRAGKWLKAKRKKKIIDRLPCNSDLQLLHTAPKLLLTSIRILFLVVVAVLGIGVDARDAFTRWEPTTHVSQLNDISGRGKPFDEQAVNSTQDLAIVGCEDITSTSIEKYKAFIGTTEFSCNSGRTVRNRKKIVEVIWKRSQVRRIVSGTARPHKVSLGLNSCAYTEDSTQNTLVLKPCNGYPKYMFVERREAQDEDVRTCENGKLTEYLILSPRPNFSVAFSDITVAYMICDIRKTVLLQNTDRMILLEEQGPAQPQRFARKVANSLLSVVPDKSEKVYYGGSRRVTFVVKYYDAWMVAISAFNVLVLVALSVYKRLTTKRSDFNPFSIHSTLIHAGASYQQSAHSDEMVSFQDFCFKVDGAKGKIRVVTEMDTGKLDSTQPSPIEDNTD